MTTARKVKMLLGKMKAVRRRMRREVIRKRSGCRTGQTEQEMWGKARQKLQGQIHWLCDLGQINPSFYISSAKWG